MTSSVRTGYQYPSPAVTMPPRLRELVFVYGLPFLTVPAAIALTLSLGYLTKESRTLSIFFFAAVMLSTWFGGRMSGFLTTAFSVLSIDFFLLKPVGAYRVNAYEIALLVVFVVLAIIMSYLVDYRRRAETQLREMNERLEQRVAERTAELAEANKIKDRFLGIVSHDLRAPLTSILGWVEIAQADGKDPSVAKALSVIKRNAHIQSRLIGDLLDLNGMKAGELRLTPEAVNVRGLIESASQRFYPSASEKEIKLSVEIADDIAVIYADKNRLVQVIDNLLTNAIKFTPNGGSISVRVEKQRSNLRLTIADDGAGIDATLLPRVFEPFRQGHANGDGHSLGLGLSIVKHVIDAHSGTVEVVSDGPGKGSAFVVTLPCEMTDTSEETVVRKRAASASSTSI